MANIVTKMAIFFLLVNIAAGVLMLAVVDKDGNRVFTRGHTMGVQYDTQSGQIGNFTDDMEQSIKPGGELEDSGDQIYRILDTLSLGFVARFVDTLKNFMFGFVVMLRTIFEPHLGAVSSYFFGALNTLISVSYLLVAIRLFTGKDLMRGL